MSDNEDQPPARNDDEITYRGVQVTKYGRYRASIAIDRAITYVGNYATSEEAAREHDRAAIGRFGTTAVLNYLPDGSLNPFRLTRVRRKQKTSMYRGVSLYGREGKYMAQLKHEGIVLSLGTFATEVEAARAYDSAAEQKRGSSAVLNFRPDGSLNPHRHSHYRRKIVHEEVVTGEQAAGKRAQDKADGAIDTAQPVSKTRRLNDDAGSS